MSLVASIAVLHVARYMAGEWDIPGNLVISLTTEA